MLSVSGSSQRNKHEECILLPVTPVLLDHAAFQRYLQMPTTSFHTQPISW